MPASDRPQNQTSVRQRVSGRPAAVCAFVLLAALVAASASFAQPQPAKAPSSDSPNAAAVKLPDGTVVFFTKNPDDANPPLDGVLLSAQEYRDLVEKADQLKKLKAAPKPQPPSECHLRGKVETRGDRTVAVLTATYKFRTTTANSLVGLGAQRAFPVSAALDGKLPLLATGDEGLSALVEAAGEHTLVLNLEAPVAPKGTKGELGFDLGLPRAAISTVALDPPKGVKKVTVGVRTPGDRASEFRRTTEDAAWLARPADKPGYPLVSPAEQLELVWDAPTAQPANAEEATEAAADVVVRVEETQVVTEVKIRLKGNPKEWSLVLPASADVSAERVAQTSPDPLAALAELPFTSPASPVINRPTDPAKPVWTFRPPEMSNAEWRVVAVVRQPRPKPTDAKFRGPYPVGPVGVPSAGRLTGTIAVYAPSTMGLTFQPAPDVQRQDVAAADKDLAAEFRFAATRTSTPKANPAPLLDIDARTIPGFLRVQPEHTLQWAEGSWRLRSEVKVTPVRMTADKVAIEFPPGWEAFAAPTDLVLSVDEPTKDAGPNRTYVLQLDPQKTPAAQPFTLTLLATYPGAAGPDAALPLPRFVGAVEQAARVTASVPAGYELRGSATGHDGREALGSQELTADSPATAAATTVSGRFDQGVSKVTLSWAPHRPELLADVQADLTLQDRQLLVEQTIRLTSPEREPRAVRIVGGPEVLGLKSQPPLESKGPNEWTHRVEGGGKESVLVVSYAVPLAGGKPLSAGLLWPESASRVETRVRIWAGGEHRVTAVSGPWRDLPVELVDGRDSLPLRTLTGTGNRLPLSLELADTAGGTLPTTTVERSLVQAWLTSEGGLASRGRFVLSRWPASGVTIELPPGAAPHVTVNDQQAAAVPDPAAPNAVRVVLPAATVDGAPVVVDVRCTQPSSPARNGAVELTPARLLRAVHRTPTRWQVVAPPDVLLVATQRDLLPDARWAWHRGLFQPTPAASSEDLEQWLGTGVAAESPAPAFWAVAVHEDALTARQSSPGGVTVYRVPRAGWVAGWSLLVVAAGLVLSRLRPPLLGPVLAVLGVGLAAAAMTWPQPTALAAAGALPGLAALAAILLAAAGVRWVYRRRITHLPGFVRTPVSSVAAAPAAVPASTTSQNPAAPGATGHGSSRRSSRPAVPASGR